MRLLQGLNNSLWGSGTRIYANHKWRFFGEANFDAHGQPSIPPDAAQVLDELRRREMSTFAQVISDLRPIDAEVTARYRRELSIPAGGSVFGDVYAQYLALEASPVMAEREELIWNAMPMEFYLLNRSAGELSDDQRAILQALYGDVTKRAEMGLTPYVPNDAEALKAIETRRLLYGEGIELYKSGAAGAILGIPRVVWGIALLIGAGVAVLYVAPAVASRLESAPVLAGLQAALDENKQRYQLNQRIIENNQPIVDYCVQYSQANGLSPEVCGDMSRSLMPWTAPVDPGEVAAAAAGATKCDAGKCMSWIAAGGVLGAIAGFVAARRLSGP